MDKRKQKAGICSVCAGKNPPAPPISPSSVAQIIQFTGQFNQAAIDNWIYFYDDQEEELHHSLQTNFILLTATCRCGCSVWETTMADAWVPIKDIKPEAA